MWGLLERHFLLTVHAGSGSKGKTVSHIQCIPTLTASNAIVYNYYDAFRIKSTYTKSQLVTIINHDTVIALLQEVIDPGSQTMARE